MDNYEKIIHQNLDRLYKNLPDNLERLLPGQRLNDEFRFKAFGETCLIRPDSIVIGDQDATGVTGILISLYALHANTNILALTEMDSPRQLLSAETTSFPSAEVMIRSIKVFGSN